MRARFIGNPEDATEDRVCVVFGVEFPVGEWVEVSNEKLAANPMFEVDADEDGSPEATVDELRARLDELGVKYHHKAGVEKLTELLAASEG